MSEPDDNLLKIAAVVRRSLAKSGHVNQHRSIMRDVIDGRVEVYGHENALIVLEKSRGWLCILAIETDLDTLAGDVALFCSKFCKRHNLLGVRVAPRPGWWRVMNGFVTQGADGSLCMMNEDLLKWADAHRRKRNKAKAFKQALADHT